MPKPVIYRPDLTRKEYAALKSKEWYAKNREYALERQRQWTAENPDKIRANNLRKFGITPDDYDLMLEKQAGGCAICRQTCKSGKALAVDHDHETGRVRGLLCCNCNHGIGKFQDSVNLLREAADYLEKHQHGVN